MVRKRRPQSVSKRLYGPHFLREWREYRGYTLEQVGEAVGISHAQLGRIERRLQPYGQRLLEALADLYRTEPASLVMRNPLDENAMWSLWEQAKQAERDDVVKFLEFRVKSRIGTG